MKNWKTTTGGVLILLTHLGESLFPNVITPGLAKEITILLTTVGFLTAGDAKTDLNSGK